MGEKEGAMPKEEEMPQAVQEIEKLRDLIVDCARRARSDGIISLRGLKTDHPLLSSVVENLCSSSNLPISTVNTVIMSTHS